VDKSRATQSGQAGPEGLGNICGFEWLQIRDMWKGEERSWLNTSLARLFRHANFAAHVEKEMADWWSSEHVQTGRIELKFDDEHEP
jgi:hypothetical protein